MGAATHDVGFEKDQRNGSVTHKIDPEIDLEREYLARTLVAAGAIAQWSHVTPRDAFTEAKTATGGSFHSDGRVLVLVLANGRAGSGGGEVIERQAHGTADRLDAIYIARIFPYHER